MNRSTPTTMAEATKQIDTLKRTVSQLSQALSAANATIEILRSERDTRRAETGR